MALFRLLKLKDIESDKRFIEVKTFKDKFTPVDGNSYKWVFEYAMNVIHSAQEAMRTLDSKAENMVRYLGPGSGILGVGFVWFTSSGLSVGLYVGILVSVGVLLIIGAILSALGALFPHEQTLGASVIDAIKVVDYYKDENQSLGYFATGLAESVIILRIVAEKKARCLCWSHRLFSIGLSCFIFGVVKTIIDKMW